MAKAKTSRRAQRKPHDDDVDVLGHVRDDRHADSIGMSDHDAIGWTSCSTAVWCGPDGTRHDDLV